MKQTFKTDKKVLWLQPDGQPVSCIEKLDVLNENLDDIQQECQDVFEDALLMGVDEKQARGVIAGILQGLVNPYEK